MVATWLCRVLYSIFYRQFRAYVQQRTVVRQCPSDDEHAAASYTVRARHIIINKPRGFLHLDKIVLKYIHITFKLLLKARPSSYAMQRPPLPKKKWFSLSFNALLTSTRLPSFVIHNAPVIPIDVEEELLKSVLHKSILNKHNILHDRDHDEEVDSISSRSLFGDMETAKYVVDMLPDAVSMIDHRGFIIHANQEFHESILSTSRDHPSPRKSVLWAISSSDRSRFYATIQSICDQPGQAREVVNQCLTTTCSADHQECDVFYDWTLTVDASKKLILAIGR